MARKGNGLKIKNYGRRIIEAEIQAKALDLIFDDGSAVILESRTDADNIWVSITNRKGKTKGIKVPLQIFVDMIEGMIMTVEDLGHGKRETNG
jgi:hypothetical protein